MPELNLLPHRRHRRVGDPQGRRQGQGPAGRRAARSSATPRASRTSRRPRTSSRRPSAAVLDPKNYRYTPAAGLPELREAIAAKTAARQRPRGRRLAGHRDQRRQAGGLPVVRDARRRGRRGARCRRPYWTTYPEAIKLAGGVPVEVFAGSRPGLPRHRRAARGRPHRRAPRCCCSCRRRTRPAPSTRPEQTRAIGEWALEHGIWVISRRDLPEPRLRRRRAPSRSSRPCPALADTHDPRQRRREDLRDDRLARRAGWSARPTPSRRAAQPAVAPLVERLEHLAARGDRGAHRPAGCGRGDAPGLRPPPQAHRRRAQRDRRLSRARPRRARSTCTPT